MILGVVLANITRKLDLLANQDGQSISSHAKLKEEGLKCIEGLIQEAPVAEYHRFFKTKDHSLLLAYLLNVLCKLAKDDKSKTIRKHSLEVMMKVMIRLESLHERSDLETTCSIKPIVSALPGISSTLFKLIMSDTKLPRELLIIALRNLTKLVCISFVTCDHKCVQENLPEHAMSNLQETCDNLAIRFNFLFDYIINNCSELSIDVQREVLDLCHSIMSKTNIDMMNRIVEPIVKYIAFVSSDSKLSSLTEVKLKVIILVDCIKDGIRNCDDNNRRLDSVIINGIFKILDNLDEHAFSILIKERQSELAILLGLLRLLPQESLTTFFELEDRKKQLINILMRLCEFSSNQPFLILTDSSISDDAIEISNSKIYSVEKRFLHLTGDEIRIVDEICDIIGSYADWLSLNDTMTNYLRKFSDPSNLYITHCIIRGCLHREYLSISSVNRFTTYMFKHYVDSIKEEFIKLDSELLDHDMRPIKTTLGIVISIETITSLVELHLKFIQNAPNKIVILKDILCPILVWASSSSRAISEAALNSLLQISLLFQFDSTRSLIEANIDYVVDGAMHMLDNFYQNHDVTNVLAVTFKLSSLNSFYFFKDVYEKIFQILALYQNTEKAQSILLLFYRTLNIIRDWKTVDCKRKNSSPLEDSSILRDVLSDLSIDRRLKDLKERIEEKDRVEKEIDQMEVKSKEEEEIVRMRLIEEIKSGKITDYLDNEDENSSEKDCSEEETKAKANEIVLTEKILAHCVPMISSDCSRTKILALKTASIGLEILRDQENTLLPLVHQLWAPLEKRLVGDYNRNLEVSLSAFECLVSMAEVAKDFIKRRTLDTIFPRICLFLESQARESKNKKDYSPYSMTVTYKCQLKILTHLGSLAYHIELAYSNLWRVVKTTLFYLDQNQMKSLQNAAESSLHYMVVLDADCVWYYSRKSNCLNDLPFQLIYYSE